MRRHSLAATAAGLMLALAGCGVGPVDDGSASGASAGTGSSTSGASTPDATDLDFSATLLDGGSFEGTSLAGRPTVLWFWAPWCATCRAQAPGVSSLARTYAGTVNVVGVGGLADEGDIRDFAQQVDGPTHLVDPEGSVWRHLGVTAQSTYLVLDADGRVVEEGYLDDQVLADRVADLAG